MRHSIYRITGFKLVGPYSLQVMFEDGIERTVDLEGVLEGEVYGPLKDRQLFAQAYLDPETHTIVWPNGADFDPETLYEWPTYARQMKEMAQRWAAAQAGV